MLNDPEVYKMLSSGDTKGVFQLDGSQGITNVLTRFKPTCIDHIAAILAAYRPAMIDSGTLERYIQRREGRLPITPVHPEVDKILEKTLGCIVFQEDIMRISNQVGGIPMGETYSLIKSISKKKRREVEKYEDRFFSGCLDSGVDHREVANLWDVIVASSRYAFNASHAYAYAFIAYQTAWLKTYYPTHFMAAVLSSEIPNRNLKERDAVVKTLEDCRRLKITVRKPSLDSTLEFTVDNGEITFALNAIKGIGNDPARKIVANAPYASIQDFIRRAGVTKTTIAPMVKLGFFDHWHPDRDDLLSRLDNLIKEAKKGGLMQCRGCELLQKDENGVGFCNPPDDLTWMKTMAWCGEQKWRKGLPRVAADGCPGFIPRVDLPDAPSGPRVVSKTHLAWERELLGFTLSGHETDFYADQALGYTTHTIPQLSSLPHKARVTILAFVASHKASYTKQGSPYYRFELDDKDSSIEGVAWSECVKNYGKAIRQGRVLIIDGHVDNRNSTQLVAKRAFLVPDYLRKHDRTLYIKAPRDVVDRFPGPDKIVVVGSEGMREPDRGVRFCRELMEEVEEVKVLVREKK